MASTHVTSCLDFYDPVGAVAVLCLLFISKFAVLVFKISLTCAECFRVCHVHFIGKGNA